MEHSQLTWEDVIQFEEIEGYGQAIWKDRNQYYFVTEEGGIAEQRVVYELSKELFELIKSGQKSLADIHHKLRYDSWPPTEEERRISRKNFIKQYPLSLIDVPQSRSLFSKEELEELIPIAEQKWIDWEGKLPDDYVSPLKKGQEQET